MKYEVKGCKDHKGHEGETLTQCNLYRDGKKVAFYSDGDWGGPSQFDWVDRGVPEVKITIVNMMDKTVTLSVSPEEANLWEHIRDMTYPLLEDRNVAMDPDIYVPQLITDYTYNKEYKRWCKTKLYFRLKDETYERGEWVSLNIKYSAEVMVKMHNRYGDNLGEILNERMAS